MRVRNDLRLLRKNRGLSLRQLHEKSGIDFGTLNKVENGMSVLSDPRLENLCNALAVTADMIYPDPRIMEVLAE